MSELVVPRSMPTASRCSCGAGDSPGSDICRSAIDLLYRLVGRVDLGVELVEELQLADQAGGVRVVSVLVDRCADLLLQRALVIGERVLQRREGVRVLPGGRI